MRIQIKLMGMLKDRTPEGGRLDLADAASIHDVLNVLEIDGDTVQAFSVNGSIERDKQRTLNDGDELIILPPVSGG